MPTPLGPGRIGWLDLTVPNAEEVRDFYTKVIGWQFQNVSMGDYDDFSMIAADGECVAGVCHTRGSNAQMPATWIPYVIVENLEASLSAVTEAGGKVRVPTRGAGPSGRFAVIEDPAGATLALFQSGQH